MQDYEPEIGQYMFGQPYKEYQCSALLEAALSSINSELCRVMWNINQEEYNSPFYNNGNSFECPVFEIKAYSWSDDEQPYNFKYKDIEISWYKHLGRGMSIGKQITNDEIAKMLDDCLEYLYKYEQENDPYVV